MKTRLYGFLVQPLPSMAAALLLCCMLHTTASAVTLGPGDIVAIDSVLGHVILVDPDTGVQTLISDEGGGTDVVVDDSGRIFMAQINDLVEVDPETGAQTFVAENLVTGGDRVTDLALTPAGDVVVSSYNAAIHIVDPDTGIATPFVGPFSSRIGVAVDSGGDLYFAAEVSDQVFRHTAAGGASIQSYALFGVPPNAFGRPGDVAIAPNGDLVVTDRNEELFLRVNTTTGVFDILGPLPFAAMSAGMAVESSGDYVVPAIELGMSVGIYRIDATTGSFVQLTTGGFLSTGGGVTAVAVAPSTLPEPPVEEDPFVSCPGDGSLLTDPIILCALGTGVAGPVFDTEAGFASNVGLVNETQTSIGVQAYGETVIDSMLGQVEIISSAGKLGATGVGEADVSSGVHWTDEVTIDALGYPGENGRFKAVILLLVDSAHTTGLENGSSVLAQTSYSLEVGTDETSPWAYGGDFGLANSIAEGPQVLDAGDPTGVYLTGFHDFVFGTPFQLDVDLALRLQTLADGLVANATADTHVRLFWLGITDIQALTGVITPVPEIWLSSSSVSGVDWRQPQGLPEPGFALLTGLGGLGLALLARRRSNKMR